MADFAKDFVPENDTDAAKAASPDRPRRDPAAAAATAAAIRANVEANAGSNGNKPRSEEAIAAAKERDTKIAQEVVRSKSGGGFYSPAFLRAVAPLYDLHMGAENLGPLLYSYVRFTKPARVLEVGAGYTSMFILQALRDNAAELDAYRELRGAGLCRCGDVRGAWMTPRRGAIGREVRGTHRVSGRRAGRRASRGGAAWTGQSGRRGTPRERRRFGPFGVSDGSSSASIAVGSGRRRLGSGRRTRVNEGLHCIDNMAHEHTAHVVTGPRPRWA